MNDAGVPIEAGPSRHILIQGLRLFTREPKRLERAAASGKATAASGEALQARLGGAAADDVPALRHAAGRRAPGSGHVGLAIAALTHFPDATDRR